MASLDELYRDFQARAESHGWARPVDLEALPAGVQPRIERVLRRRALAVVLHTDEIFSKFQKAAVAATVVGAVAAIIGAIATLSN